MPFGIVPWHLLSSVCAQIKFERMLSGTVETEPVMTPRIQSKQSQFNAEDHLLALFYFF